MILDFPGRRIRRAVPASRFSNFIAADGVSVADIPLSHFVSHIDIVRSPSRHVRRSLRRQTWYLRPRIRSAQLTNCTQFFFFLTVLRVVQTYSAWCFCGSSDVPWRRPPLVYFSMLNRECQGLHDEPTADSSVSLLLDHFGDVLQQTTTAEKCFACSLVSWGILGIAIFENLCRYKWQFCSA